MRHYSPNKIVIIDDQEEFAWMLKHVLEALGYAHIIVAIGGKAGKKAIKAEKPGIVFLDINMPDLNGYELLKKIKSGRKTSGIRVVMVSGEEYETAVAKSYHEFADAFISKPVDIVLLESVLNSLPVSPGY